MFDRKQRRSRSGCLTCRSRHLKCDEATPECMNCRRSNKQCERGIRIKMTQTVRFEVERNAFNYAPLGEYKFLDQSIAVASDYVDGDASYRPYAGLHTREALDRSLDDYRSSWQTPAPKRAKYEVRSPHMRVSLVHQIEHSWKDRDEKSYHVLEKESSTMGDSTTSVESPSQVTTSESPVYSSKLVWVDDTKPYLVPLRNREESLLLANFIHHCTWLLDFISNGNMVSPYFKIWEDDIIPNMVLRDAELLQCIFRCSLSFPPDELKGLLPARRNPKIARPLYMRAVSSTVQHKIYIDNTNRNQERLLEEIKRDGLVEAGLSPKPIEITKAKEKMEKFMVSATLICMSGYFDVIVSGGDHANVNALRSHIHDVSRLILDNRMFESVVLSTSKVFDCCFMVLFSIDMWSGMVSKQPTILNPYELMHLLPLKPAMEESVGSESRISSNNTIERAPVEEITDAASEPDAMHLSRIIAILAKIYTCGDLNTHNLEEKWNDLIEEMYTFERELPFVFAPCGFTKVVDSEASQALLMKPEAKGEQNMSRAMDVFNPPFMKIQFSNPVNLLVHLLHHAAYLVSESIRLEHCPSFFEKTKSNGYWDFRIIKWYDCNTAVKHAEYSPPEDEHMAIRVISMLLSVEVKSSRIHSDGNQINKGQIVFPHFRWLYELALDFLSKETRSALDAMLSDLRPKI